MPPDENTSEQLASLQRGLGRIEGKVDSLMAAQTLSQGTNNTRADTLEKRLRGVENRQYFVSGASGLGGLIVGYLGHLGRLFGIH